MQELGSGWQTIKVRKLLTYNLEPLVNCFVYLQQKSREALLILYPPPQKKKVITRYFLTQNIVRLKISNPNSALHLPVNSLP